jgi:hypothetical protein
MPKSYDGLQHIRLKSNVGMMRTKSKGASSVKGSSPALSSAGLSQGLVDLGERGPQARCQRQEGVKH